MDGNKPEQIIGEVSTRKCPACGHHEVGVITAKGMFYPLKPGSRIQVLELPIAPEPPVILQDQETRLDPEPSEAETPSLPWIPEPVKNNPALRKIYGVLLSGCTDSTYLTGALYQSAYIEKIRHMIEKEVLTPIPVLLDRFFTAPHLASGDALDVAVNLWKNLDEIKDPVERIMAWIDQPDAENLDASMSLEPEGPQETEKMLPSQLKKELNELCLEEFFELLLALHTSKAGKDSF
jgi:hypothetical protein